MANEAGISQLRELVVSIVGEHDDALDSFDAIIRGMDAVETKTNLTNKTLGDFSKALAAVSVALTTMNVLAVKAFAEFEQSIHNAGGVIGATKDQMEKLASVARGAWDIPTFKAKESADAMYYLASAGYSAEQIIDTMSGTLKLAAATQSNLAFTSESVVSTLNQFGLEATDTDRVVNVLAATISFTQATLERMRESLKFVGPVANALGISLEQVSAALGIMYNAGIKAEQAGTSLRAGLTRLQAPTNQAIKAMGHLGLTFDQLNPQTHNLVEIIATLEKAIGGKLATSGDELAKIFGVESVTAFQVLVKQGAQALSAMETKLTGTNKATEVANIQLDTLNATLLTAGRAMNELAIEAGRILAPAVKAVALAFKDLLLGFVNLPEILKQIIVYGGAFTAVLTGLAAPILFLVSQLPKIELAFISLVELISGISAPILLATAAIIGLGYALVKLRSNQEEVQRTTQKDIEYLQQHYSARMQTVQAVQHSANEFVKLAAKSKDASEIEGQMAIVIEKINTLYPALISQSDDFATKMLKIQNAASQATSELKRLHESQIQLEKIKVTIEISELKKSISEARRDLETGVGAFDKFFSNKRNVALNIKLDDALQTFEDIKKVANEVIVTYSKMDPFTQQVKENGAIISANGAELLSMAEKLAATDSGRAKILGDLSVLTNLEMKATEGILAIRAKTIEQNRDLSDEEKISVRGYEAQKESAAALSGTYTEVLKKAAKMVELEQNLAAAEGKRLELMKGIEDGTKPAVVPVTNKGSDSSAFSKREMEKQKVLALRREEFERDLHQKTLEAELAADKVASDRSLAGQIANIEKQYAVKQQLLLTDKERQIAFARTINFDTVKVEQAFAAQSIAVQDQKYNEIAKVHQKYMANEQAARLLQMDFEQINNETDLAAYKAFLYTKLSIAEEWSDEYVAVLRNITEIERGENEKRKRSAQNWADAVSSIADNVGIALEGTFRKGVTDVWKESLNAIIDTLAEHYKNVLKMDLEVALALQQWGRVAKDLIGIAAISALASASKASIGRARIGATVLQDGATVVHQGETIVPAKIARRSNNFYDQENKRTMGGKMDESGNMNMPPIIVQVHNPMVGNQEFWNQIFQEHIPTAIYHYEKRFKRAK